MAVVLSLLVAESILRILCVFSPEVSMALLPPSKWATLTSVVQDPKLKYRGDPRVPEHDLLGFRNPEVPLQCTIVAIGDSQTYGTSVDWRQAWSMQVGRLSGLQTYNMGCSGWGPIQYREILPDALKFKPRLVIVALYFGNDLFDAYRDSYFHPTGADLRDRSKYKDLQKLELDDPSLKKMGELYLATTNKDALPSEASHDPGSIEQYSKLYTLMVATWRVVSGLNRKSENEKWEQTKSWAGKNPDHLAVVDTNNARTILTFRYRGVAVDRQDKRIIEGQRIAHLALEQIAKRCQEADTGLLVVLIPTKESVFAEMAGEKSKQLSYQKLLDDEKAAVEITRVFLDENEITFVDTLPALRNCFRKGTNPYLPSADGHPSPAGHRAIAEAILDHPLLERLYK